MKLIGYFIKLRGLMNLKRYQNLFLFKQRSVAEHSWSVSKIAHALAYIEKHQFGNEVDMATLLQKTLFHDSIEVLTGDILSLTKRKTKSMKRSVALLEKKVFNEEFVDLLPSESWKEDFQKFTLDAKDNTVEGKILHASDIIDTLFEAIEEIQLGNIEYFVGVVENGMQKLFSFEIPSVQYFLQNFVAYIENMRFDFEGHFSCEFLEKLEQWKSGIYVEPEKEAI